MSFSIDYDIVVNDDNCTDLSKEYSSLAGQLEEKLSKYLGSLERIL